MEWGKEEKEEEGGITWIEFYAWHTIHGGQEEDEEERNRDPLRKTPMLQQQVADFKKDVRKIKKFAVPEEQEWVLETEYSKKHRLKGAGTGNRQAAIRGIPKVNKEDAHTIMKSVIAIRGLDKKKHMK